MQGNGTTNGTVPFWMRSNQFGSIPLSGASTSFIAKAYKGYDSTKTIDWGFGTEARANLGSTSKFILTEGYIKVRAGIFELSAGRTKDVMGFNSDQRLSSGNFSVSGNALGIPKISVSIPEYWSPSIFNDLIAIKGSLSHGWTGKLHIADVISSTGPGGTIRTPVDRVDSYLHQKALYARLGTSNWKLKLHGGINHQVIWGNERYIYGETFGLSPIETFFFVATGKAYGRIQENGIPRSKIGNHLGSIDLAVEYDFPTFNLLVYRQNFYDVGAIAKLANIKDGLNGISLTNKKFTDQSHGIRWKKATFEFLYSKDQAGLNSSRRTKSGDENYYNNFFYRGGWSYKGLGLGTPFFTANNVARKGSASDPIDFFINNRVVAFHLGLDASIERWDYLLKTSFSRNHGTFATSPEGRTTGSLVVPPRYGLFGAVSQFSAYLEANRKLRNGFSVGYIAAADKGKLLYNSTGLILKIRKDF
ncbi:capsule assembly Wzi family protein [Arcticibacter pallidicorallinus]|nr:capsule assembly Wzi family protein [Arcticibacter pallidicorallinus]